MDTIMGWIADLFSGQIIEYIMAAVIAWLGWRWVVLKKLIKEVQDLVDVVGGALDDDKMTEDELKAINKELSEVLAAVKELIGKQEKA